MTHNEVRVKEKSDHRVVFLRSGLVNPSVMRYTIDMPAKGYRKPTAKSGSVHFRLKPEQKAAYQKAAERAGYETISKWARSVLDAVAGLGGESEKG